jgi:hypothetical protein
VSKKTSFGLKKNGKKVLTLTLRARFFKGEKVVIDQQRIKEQALN